MELNGTLAFVHVVRAGSFTGAARNLALPASTVSDRVASLEKSLGVTLLIRTTRKLKLTEAGTKYFEKAEAALSLLENANDEATSLQLRPSGTLRISTPSEFVPHALAEIIVEYQKKLPGVKIEAYQTNRYVDMIGEGFDLAIRGGKLADSSMMVKRVGEGRFIFISSEKYLKGAPQLKHPKDLSEHSCLGFLGHDLSREEVPWKVQSSDGRRYTCKPRFTASVTSFVTIIEMVKAGAGVALVPRLYASEALKSKSVVQVLPQWETGFTTPAIVYPQQKFHSPKVREMISLMENRLRRILVG